MASEGIASIVPITVCGRENCQSVLTKLCRFPPPARASAMPPMPPVPAMPCASAPTAASIRACPWGSKTTRPEDKRKRFRREGKPFNEGRGVGGGEENEAANRYRDRARCSCVLDAG